MAPCPISGHPFTLFKQVQVDDGAKGTVRVGLPQVAAVCCMRRGASTAPPWLLLDPPPSTQTPSVLVLLFLLPPCTPCAIRRWLHAQFMVAHSLFFRCRWKMRRRGRHLMAICRMMLFLPRHLTQYISSCLPAILVSGILFYWLLYATHHLPFMCVIGLLIL